MRATGTVPALVRVIDESSGAAYENERVRKPLCSDTETEDDSPSEIPGGILQTNEVPETCNTVVHEVVPNAEEGL